MKKIFGIGLVIVVVFVLVQVNIIKVNFGEESASTEVAIKASAPAVRAGDTVTVTAQTKLFTLDYVLYLDGQEFARTDGTGTFTKAKANELFKFVSSIKDGDRMQIVLKSLKAGNVRAKFGVDSSEAATGTGQGILTLKKAYSPEINLTVTE